MIKRKDLIRRTYDGKICVSFDYVLKDENGVKLFDSRFTRDSELLNVWNVLIMIGKTDISETQVYSFGFMLHSAEVSLELVAATGLTMFKNNLADEIQKKSAINFLLGEELRGL